MKSRNRKRAASVSPYGNIRKIAREYDPDRETERQRDIDKHRWRMYISHGAISALSCITCSLSLSLPPSLSNTRNTYVSFVWSRTCSGQGSCTCRRYTSGIIRRRIQRNNGLVEARSLTLPTMATVFPFFSFHSVPLASLRPSRR